MKSATQICKEVRESMSREAILLGLDNADLIHDLDYIYKHHPNTGIREDYCSLRCKIIEASINESYDDRDLLIKKLVEKYGVPGL